MELSGHISISDIGNILNSTLQLSSDATNRIAHNRAYLDNILKGGSTYYGINTGFGSLCNVRIKDSELAQLQENLVTSHACGMGDEVPEEIVRMMLMLKVHGLSQGYSGVRTEIVQRLADFYNLGIYPVIHELGSLGASGDLAPLAHMCLPLFGKGRVNYKGSKIPASEALQQAGLQPLRLAAKEGLALLNGTQFMSAYSTWSLIKSKQLLLWADV